MGKPINEFTGCGGVGAAVEMPMGNTFPGKKLTFKLKKKKQLKENDSIFPTGANPVDPGQDEGGIVVDQDELETTGNNPEEPQIPEPLIPVTAALVAPDCTPDWFKPLDPSTVPQTPAAASPTTSPEGDPVLNMILNMGKHAVQPGQTNATTVESQLQQAMRSVQLESVVANAMTPGAEQPPPTPHRDLGDSLSRLASKGLI